MQERLVWLENNGYLNSGTIKNTRTTKFLMPLIGVSEKELDNHCLDMFINAYIKNKEELTLYVVLNKLDFPEESMQFIILQNLNEHYLCFMENDQEYIIEYEIPEHFREDFDKILDGKYSETSAPYKQIMTRVHGIRKDDNDPACFIYEVIYPTDRKRELKAKDLSVGHSIIDKSIIKEVSSKPNLEYEEYVSIEQLKFKDFGTKQRRD